MSPQGGDGLLRFARNDGFSARLLLVGALDAFRRSARWASSASPQRSTFTHLPCLEILVVLEEVLDLLQRDVGKVAVGLDLVVALGQLWRTAPR